MKVIISRRKNGKQVEVVRLKARRDANIPGLLFTPDLIERIGVAIRAGGYAGDLNVPLLVFVSLSSRWLERPLNLAIVAPSAAGKNRAIDSVLPLFPADAYHVVKACTPRALIYSGEDFQHRVIVLAEADSLPFEGSAASAMRSLAEDNEMVYEVTERSKVTGRNETRRIVKPGPTGLITTSTRSLGHEMSTRMLEITLSDDPKQTRAILIAHADAAAGRNGHPTDWSEFVAIQAWLGRHGVRRVVVPFARSLAERLATSQVRTRRDFRQLITCISTVAFLFQLQRDRTEDGAVLATIADYGVARALLARVFDSIAEDGLTDAIRETVEAVPLGSSGVTESYLARTLGVAKSTVSYRVSRAVRRGWLNKDVSRRGLPVEIRRGEPLPDRVSSLPTPEEVQEAFERSSEITGSEADTSARRTVRVIRVTV